MTEKARQGRVGLFAIIVLVVMTHKADEVIGVGSVIIVLSTGSRDLAGGVRLPSGRSVPAQSVITSTDTKEPVAPPLYAGRSHP